MGREEGESPENTASYYLSAVGIALQWRLVALTAGVHLDGSRLERAGGQHVLARHRVQGAHVVEGGVEAADGRQVVQVRVRLAAGGVVGVLEGTGQQLLFQAFGGVERRGCRHLGLARCERCFQARACHVVV